ncbi:MAG: hypothetical protein C4584_00275 [Armatimonadetes bacterium]|nr:MAG: hypothetical protein C4584_00275 [Armatimonadota bacterium]
MPIISLMNNTERWLSGEIRMTRRQFIRNTFYGAIGSATGALGVHHLLESRNTQPPKSTTEKKSNSPPLFKNQEADEIAAESEIHAGTFFYVPENTVNNLNAYKESDLLPIFPPAVLERKKLIYDLAQEFSLPQNIIATIMTIESAGYEEAHSWAGAIGLFQPLDDKFPPELQYKKDNNGNIIDTPDEAEKKLRQKLEPYTNGRTGISYFKNICLPVSRSENADYPPDHPVVFARAFVSYNAGPGFAGAPFENLPPETQLYADHFIRFLVTLEIAQKLREKGYSDPQIVNALRSNEVDARAFALNQYIERKRTEKSPNKNEQYFTYQEYNTAVKALAENNISSWKENPDPTKRNLHKDYEKYLEKPVYELPLSPGLRIWTALSSDLSLFFSDPQNGNPQEWKNIPTQN